MIEKDLSQLSDQELLEEAKKKKSSRIMHALLIGFCAGIILFSILVNALGWFTLIPLYFIYKMLKYPDNYQEIERLLKERGLNQ